MSRIELINKKAGWFWYLKEEHYTVSCTCSFCNKIKSGKKWQWRIWKPAFRYWRAGWWTLIHLNNFTATYWRVTLL